MEPDELKFGTDSVLEGINETSDNSASGTTRSEFFVLLDLISKLTDDTSDGKRSFMMNFNMKATTSHILADKKRQSHLMLLYFISIH